MKEQTWDEAQIWERKWWNEPKFGGFANTFREEQKQFIYMKDMGLPPIYDHLNEHYYWNFKEETVLDIGGGVVSVLLKSSITNSKKIVLDPLNIPEWAKKRYTGSGISYIKKAAEDALDENYFEGNIFDIGLIYNVLPHTKEPEKVVALARKYCKTFYLYEFCFKVVTPGHLHKISEEDLNKWTGGIGKTKRVYYNNNFDFAYFGKFKGV